MSMSEFRRLAGIANPNERSSWKLNESKAEPVLEISEAHAAPFLANLRNAALKNTDFRRVVYTGDKVQFTLMHIPPNGEIGEETHTNVEQVFFCASGGGKTVFDGEERPFSEGDVLVIPPGTKHNIVNVGMGPLKFFTSYTPPNHLPRLVHHTKADADADTEDAAFGQRVAKSESLDETTKVEQMTTRLKAHSEKLTDLVHSVQGSVGSPMEFYAVTGDLVASVAKMLGKGSGDLDLMNALADVAAALAKRSAASRHDNNWASVPS